MTTVGDILPLFITKLKTEKKSPHTIKAYSRDVLQVLKSKADLSLINNQLIESLKDTLTGADFSNQTIARKLNSIKKFTSFLYEMQLLEKPVDIDFGGSTVSLRKQHTLSREEYLLLREYCKQDQRLATIVELLLQTGIKIGELAELTYGDLDLSSNPTIRIRSRNQKIPLNSKIKYVLDDYLRAFHPKKISKQALFFTSQGNHIHVRNIRGMISNLYSKAGIIDATVNDLRNTFIVNQLEAGLSIDLVASFVGHNNILTTKRYLELLTKDYKESSLRSPVEL